MIFYNPFNQCRRGLVTQCSGGSRNTMNSYNFSTRPGTNRRRIRWSKKSAINKDMSFFGWVAIIAVIVLLGCTAWIGGHEYWGLPDPGLNAWGVEIVALLVLLDVFLVVFGSYMRDKDR